MSLILYSYRRCPYAMRARMALHISGLTPEIREISLRDKPAALLQASPKGTIPVLVINNGSSPRVIEQSLEIMHWALAQHDPENWLAPEFARDMQALIAANDGPFKRALDGYKYPERYPGQPREAHRADGEILLRQLETRLQQTRHLVRPDRALADIALFPFVRQFAAVDGDWFARADYPALRNWLTGLVDSPLFTAIMQKYPTWQPR